MRNLLKPRTFVVAAVAMLLSGGAYAFTASNTVPATTAGNGSAAISGYTVSNVTYALSSSSPGTPASPVITGITFTLTGTSATVGATAPTVEDAVFATGSSSSADYSSCTGSWTKGTTGTSTHGTGTYTCSNTTAPATVAEVTSLAITASNSSSSTL